MDQMRNDFTVSLRGELISGFGQFLPKFFKILDDAVMNNGDLSA